MRSVPKLLHFPLGGLNRAISYRDSTTPAENGVYGTPDSMNVVGPCPFAGRSRGGSRPGLRRFDVVSDGGDGVWFWPNGEPVVWPGEGAVEVSFSAPAENFVGPDGTKVINPHAVFVPTASLGSVPKSVSASCFYRARMFVSSGSDWFCSRTGDVADWDYGGDSEDASRAAAGNVALAGARGDDIVAFMPVGDSMLYVATARSLWCIVGEPTSGGMTLVSDSVGCCGPNAWCFDGRNLWFMSYRGLHVLAPGEKPVYFSSSVPGMSGFGSGTLVVSDNENAGVYVFSKEAGSWYVDREAKALWPISFADESMFPVSAAHVMDGGVDRVAVVGGDGVWRVFDPESEDDDGVAIASHVVIGPFRTSTSDDVDGMLAEVYATIGHGSELVTAGIFPANNPEEAVSAAEEDYGEACTIHLDPTWNRVVRPRVRGPWCAIRLSSAGRWAYESMKITCKSLGRLR